MCLRSGSGAGAPGAGHVLESEEKRYVRFLVGQAEPAEDLVYVNEIYHSQD